MCDFIEETAAAGAFKLWRYEDKMVEKEIRSRDEVFSLGRSLAVL